MIQQQPSLTFFLLFLLSNPYWSSLLIFFFSIYPIIFSDKAIKELSILEVSLAEVSKNSTPKLSANFFPYSKVTTLLSSRSLLLPTRILLTSD